MAVARCAILLAALMYSRMLSRITRSLAIALMFAVISLTGNGWCQVLDHKVALDTSGVWNPDAYRSLLIAMTVGQIGLAVWEGGETRLGNTAWRGIDSEIIAAVSAQALKYATTRVRPSNTDNPGLWFQGGSNYSFPSGEAAEAASIVTPYILEYGQEHPAVYALTLVPLYVGVARVKAQAHWQTDVLAGWAVGGLAGWYAHERDSPLLLQIMPHGIFVGLKKKF